eukprot:scaffold32420_cov68-Phaeocystis_antarctica.AAC.4
MDDLAVLGVTRQSDAFKLKNPKTSKRLQKLQDKVVGFETKLRILISLYQMLQGIGITFDIRWPDLYGDVLNFLGSIFQLDLPQAMAINCFANFNYFGSLVVRTGVPLVLMVLMSGASKLLIHFKRHQLAETMSSSCFFFLFLVYPGCSSAVFQTFMCDRLDDGSGYLRVDYSIQCYGTDDAGNVWSPEYTPLMLYAVLMTFIYPLGTPLLYAAMMYANYEAVSKADELERALIMKKRSEDNCKHKVREATDQLRKEAISKIRRDNLGAGGLAKLTAPYELRVYWFEVFECVRKVCLVGLPIFVEHGSAAQLIMGLFVCFISFGMYASFEPYVEESDNWLSKICQISLFVSLVSSIALKIETDSSAGTLGVLLLFTVAVPPVLAFLSECDIDFENTCHISKVKDVLLLRFNATVGRRIKSLLERPSETADQPSMAGLLEGTKTRPKSGHSLKINPSSRLDDSLSAMPKSQPVPLQKMSASL